ncbi:Cell cycle serine/threonine-protein kinase hsk1 [Psilocybe cubensis]|nr:Cell cycle serine/threonine-protein kinase hsk1 [Psilocybe cubensis]KAH9482230.1 Cell cycle serine/threonine-protein kinase hsk1 [Psilocybe cubensis]
MEFSHHSSNPLEASTSDATNTAYKRVLDRTRRNQSSCASSDELGHWSNRDEYLEHIGDVTGMSVSRVVGGGAKRGGEDVTPKAGSSRLRSRVVLEGEGGGGDGDEMQSEEEEDELNLSPRKNVVAEMETPRGQMGRAKAPPKFGVLVIPPFRKKEDVAAKAPMEDVANEVVQEDQEEEQGMYEDEDAVVQMEMQQREEQGEQFIEVDENGQYLDLHEIDDDEMAEEEDERSSSPLTPCSSDRSSPSPYSSPQSSRPSSPNEAYTLTKRPPEEQDEIREEFEELYDAVPALREDYELVDRLGTGTFSSVYKAIDRNYREFHNAPWLGHHPPQSSAYYQAAGPGYKGRGGRAARWRRSGMDMDVDGDGDGEEERVPEQVFVAIKRIYTTSGPERIRNELAIMEECRSCRHTSQIITAFRNEDQVVIVLPYQRNMDFREFYQDLHPEGIKCYFRCLFRALRDIHERGIIHRDVKPANFLYNPFTGVGTLCDFGLASRMEVTHPLGKCMHTHPTLEEPHGAYMPPGPAEIQEIKQKQKLARARCNMPSEKVGYPEKDTRPSSKANRAGTRGFRAPEVLLKCGSQSGAIDVWSAGIILLFFLTGKFPIFQSNDDIEGLMEIAVIIGKRKIERAATLHGRTIATNIPDLDQDGISWKEFVERLNPGIKEPRKYDMRFYPHNSKHRDGRGSMMPPPPPPPSSSPTSLDGSDTLVNPTSASTAVAAHKQSDRHANPPSAERHAKEMKYAFDFLEMVLHFESTKRATPRKALYHKFLEDEAGAPEDDDVAPRRNGEGQCEKWHTVDPHGNHYAVLLRPCWCRSRREDVLGEPEEEIDLDEESEDELEDGHGLGQGGACTVLVPYKLILNAGEGVAFGREPCELHKADEYRLWTLQRNAEGKLVAVPSYDT